LTADDSPRATVEANETTLARSLAALSHLEHCGHVYSTSRDLRLRHVSMHVQRAACRISPVRLSRFSLSTVWHLPAMPPSREAETIYDDVPEGRRARTAVDQPHSLEGSSPSSTRSATAAGANVRLSPSSTLQRPSTPFTCESRWLMRHNQQHTHTLTGLVRQIADKARGFMLTRSGIPTNSIAAAARRLPGS
jgi:hypothetical protein